MRRAVVVMSALIVVLAGVVPAAATPKRHAARGQAPVPGLMITESTRSFEATYDALRAALEAVGPVSIVAEIDHAANADRVGLQLPPTREVFFGNPALGTPLMQADQVAGIDLPQKVLVWQQRDRVFVAYNSVRYLAARHDVAGVDTLDTIADALATFTSAATGVDVDEVGTASGVRSTALLRRIARRPGLRTIRSERSFDDTVAALTAAIEQAPPQVVFTVDHQANAASAGLDLRPTTLIVFGNPALGTPLMQQRRTIGIDLPQKFLVHEDAAGHVFITSNSPFAIARRHRLPDERATLRAIATALRTLSGAAAGG